MPKSTKKPTREQLQRFVEGIARRPIEWRGQENMALAPAWICQARRLLGREIDECDTCGVPQDDLVELPDERICNGCLNGDLA